MDTTVIRVSEPRELLAYIPYRLGYRPSASLVAVSLRGPRRRLGLVARVDLAELAATGSGAEVAASLAGHLEADGAADVVLVVYDDAPRAEVRAGRGPAGLALAREREALASRVADAWLIGPTGYAGVACADDRCCPPSGRPLVELESTQVGAHMVLAGTTVEECRGDLRVRWRASAPARRTAARAASDERGRRRAARARSDRTGTADALIRSAERGMEFWDHCRLLVREGREPGPDVLGRVLVALEDAALRDEMMLRLVAESDRQGPVEPRRVLHQLFMPGGIAPDQDVVLSARRVLESVVAHAEDRRSAPALAVLAWLAWWEGEGARAGVLVEQCLAAHPGYRLAQLLRDALARGIAPGWAHHAAEEDVAGVDGAESRDRPGDDAGPARGRPAAG
jgi:hypothetical protein